MTRRTEAMQRRGKQTARRGESSGSRPRPREHPPAQPLRHPLLQGLDRYPGARERCLEIVDKPFEASRKVDWEVLRSLGLQNQVMHLIHFGGWDRIFNISEPTYKELSCEFLATFAFNKRPLTWSGRSLTFVLGGRRYELSITQISVYMGFYTEEFATSDEYEDLIHDFPEHYNVVNFWREISRTSTYDPTRSKASTLIFPELRYVHKLLVHTICGRRDSTGVVTKRDLFFLYSMRERVKIHLGYAVISYFESQANRPRIGAICCGPYITKLARALGLFTDMPPLTQVCEMVFIDMESLRYMGMVVKQQRTSSVQYVLAGAPIEAQDQPEGPTPETEQHAQPSQPPIHATQGPSSSSTPSAHHDRRMLRRLQAIERHNLWIEGALLKIGQHLGIEIPAPPNNDESSDEEGSSEETDSDDA